MPAKISDCVVIETSGDEPASDVVLERISDGYFALDHEWRFIYLDPQCDQLLRRPGSELLGVPFCDAFPDSDIASAYEHFHRAVEQGVVLSFEFYWHRHDAWFSARIYPSDTGLSVFLRDVTEELASREQLAF